MRTALAALLVVAACGGADDSGGPGTALVNADGLVVTDAWTRPSPPGVDEAAIYITVENDDAPDDRLIGASSDRCTVVSPHLTRFDDNNIVTMTKADDDQLGLTRGEQVTMEPNGLHLMCLGLVDEFAAGERFTLTLRFSEHAPVDTPVTVEQR